VSKGNWKGRESGRGRGIRTRQGEIKGDRERQGKKETPPKKCQPLTYRSGTGTQGLDKGGLDVVSPKQEAGNGGE
jgi:hypothetical protein